MHKLIVKIDGDKIREAYTGYEIEVSPSDNLTPYIIKKYNNKFLSKQINTNGSIYWTLVESLPSNYKGASMDNVNFKTSTNNDISTFKVDDEIRNIINDSIKLKPVDLIMPDVNWKYLVRSALRGSNILLVGHSGCGKTFSAYALKDALNRSEKFFRFNMGATQDPRATIIGNTHYNKDDGTFFAPSHFVEAIQTENAIILLDELSRAHPEASNILMTVLDRNQRYLRLDEDPKTPTIKVANGVTFIATANIGGEYTGTRLMDRALLDRMDAIIEVPLLNKDQEFNLLKLKFPDINKQILNAIAEIASFTRQDINSDDPKLSTIISTRATIEMAELIADGFKFTEVMQVKAYPFYSNDGGVDSERTYITQKVQQFSHLDSINELSNSDEPDMSKSSPNDNFSFDDDDLFDLNEDTFGNL